MQGLAAHLLQQGRLFPGVSDTGRNGGAMFRIQTGRMTGHIDRTFLSLIPLLLLSFNLVQLDVSRLTV